MREFIITVDGEEFCKTKEINLQFPKAKAIPKKCSPGGKSFTGPFVLSLSFSFNRAIFWSNCMHSIYSVLNKNITEPEPGWECN